MLKKTGLRENYILVNMELVPVYGIQHAHTCLDGGKATRIPVRE